MDSLEQTKDVMRSDPAVSDSATAKSHVESFALSIFYSADTDDRDGKATQTTAKAFAASSKFLEVLGAFGDIDADTVTKIRYAKWKAADIAKALREGRKPAPGAPGEADTMLIPAPEHDDVAPKNGEVAPNGDAQEAERPCPSTTLDADTDAAHPAELSLPSVPRNEARGIATQPLSETAHPAAPLAQTSPAPAPSAPVVTDTPPPKSAPQPTAPPSSRPPLDFKTVAHVQKLSRWASSALDYDDLDTAKRHLREALAALEL